MEKGLVEKRLVRFMLKLVEKGLVNSFAFSLALDSCFEFSTFSLSKIDLERNKYFESLWTESFQNSKYKFVCSFTLDFRDKPNCVHSKTRITAINCCPSNRKTVLAIFERVMAPPSPPQEVTCVDTWQIHEILKRRKMFTHWNLWKVYTI